MNTKEIENLILSNLDISLSDIENWKNKQYRTNLAIADKFINLVKYADHILIFGDYDYDGISATYITYKSIKSLFPDKLITPLFPKRSEGYGVNDRMVDTALLVKNVTDKVLVITVDTGITAKDRIQTLKDAGIKVALTDHHEFKKPEDLPPADIIIDPSVDFISNPFGETNLCGAAVAYKLFEPYLRPSVRQELKCFAGVATVTDCIEMRGFSWQIVHQTLELFSQGKSPTVLNNLLIALEQDPLHLREDAFGFYLGPVFNAAGRLYDEGPEWVFDYLINPSDDKKDRLVEINEERKTVKDTEFEWVCEAIRNENKEYTNPIWIYVPNMHHGVVGILASHVVEEFKASAIVLTDKRDALGKPTGLWSGSARSYGNFNMFEYLNKNKDHFVGMGGHPGAAGMTINPNEYEYLSSFTEPISEQESDFKTDPIEITPAQISAICPFVDSLRPYGEGFAEPIFAVDLDLNKTPYKLVGSEHNHLSIFNRNPSYKITHFFHIPNDLSNQNNFTAIGKIHSSYFAGYNTPELGVDYVNSIDVKTEEEELFR